MAIQKFTRIVTHTDLDGLTCTLLLWAVYGEMPVLFTEPWKITNGELLLEPGDILTDLPLPAEGVALWFDHHAVVQDIPQVPSYHLDDGAKSCARVIFDHYKDDHELSQYERLVQLTDKVDNAEYTEQDILDPPPESQISLALLQDKENHDLRIHLIKLLLTLTVVEAAEDPHVQERFQAAKNLQDSFLTVAKKISRREGRVLIVDLTDKPTEHQHGSSLFKLYVEFPDLDYFIIVRPDSKLGRPLHLVVAKSTFSPPSDIHLGRFVKKYGGGGHEGIGGCGIPVEEKDRIIAELVSTLNG